MSNHAKGLALTAFGGMMLTVDIPLIRLADGNAWSIMLMRTGATFLSAILIWSILRMAGKNVPQLIPGRIGLMVAALYAMGTIAFMLAVFNTSTANLVFILAFNSMFAALLSWLFLKERPAPSPSWRCS